MWIAAPQIFTDSTEVTVEQCSSRRGRDTTSRRASFHDTASIKRRLSKSPRRSFTAKSITQAMCLGKDFRDEFRKQEEEGDDHDEHNREHNQPNWKSQSERNRPRQPFREDSSMTSFRSLQETRSTFRNRSRSPFLSTRSFTPETVVIPEKTKKTRRRKGTSKLEKKRSYKTKQQAGKGTKQEQAETTHDHHNQQRGCLLEDFPQRV